MTGMRKTMGRVFGRAAVMVALVASMVAVNPATASAVVAPADGYGFAQGYTWATGNPADSAREIAAVGKTTATWVRLPLDWGSSEPAPASTTGAISTTWSTPPAPTDCGSSD